MIYAEYLKLIRNRQAIVFFVLWLVINVFLIYLSKGAYVNKTIYAVLNNDEKYFVNQHQYFKIIGFFTFLFIGLIMNASINGINTLSIKNRIIALPKNKHKLNLSQLLAFQLVFLGVSLIANIIISINFYLLFGSNLPIGKLVGLTGLMWALNIMGTATVISFFHIVLIWLKKPLTAVIVCVLVCLFSLVCPIKIIPLQWAVNLIPISSTNLEMNYLYCFLCLLTIAISYFKLSLSFNKINTFIFVLIGISFSSCNENTESVNHRFIPENNIVYIAFSLECDICINELNEINKNLDRLNLNQIEILTIDSDNEIKSYFETAGINPAIKVTSIGQETLRNLFGTLSFPQTIIFDKEKKIEIGKGYLKMDTLLLYAKK